MTGANRFAILLQEIESNANSNQAIKDIEKTKLTITTKYEQLCSEIKSYLDSI